MQGNFATYAALEDYLDGLGLFRMTPGLERMQAVLARLDLARLPFFVVQVVGTNGKGSTSTMLSALAAAEGLRVGLHTSPHFVSVRERVRLNGAMLPQERWLECAERIMHHGGESLSYFEFVTCLAVQAFALLGVDLAIMETGLGGTFDATSALDADAVVFTPIALDHQGVLGSTLEEIAKDKAGAVRHGKPVYVGAQRPLVLDILKEKAKESAAPFHVCTVDAFLSEGPEAMRLALAGEHQRDNARLALGAWREIRKSLLPGVPGASGVEGNCGAADTHSAAGAELTTFTGTGAAKTVSPEMLWEKALASAWLPGRMQTLPPSTAEEGAFSPGPQGWPAMLLDGAHNTHGLAALGKALAKSGIAPLAVVFACLGDKDPDSLIPHLRALATGKIFVPPITGNPRAMPPEELAARIGLNAEPAPSLEDALRMAAGHMLERMPELFESDCAKVHRHPLLLCGSLYLLGEFYELRPQALER